MGDPRRNEIRARRERKHPLEYLIFVFVVATAVATGFAAYYTGQQWKTAHDTLVVSERAFVDFGGANAVVGRDPDPKKSEVLTVFTSITNSGKAEQRD